MSRNFNFRTESENHGSGYDVDGKTYCDGCFFKMADKNPNLDDQKHLLDNKAFLLKHGDSVFDTVIVTNCSECGRIIAYDIPEGLDPEVDTLRKKSK